MSFNKLWGTTTSASRCIWGFQELYKQEKIEIRENFSLSVFCVQKAETCAMSARGSALNTHPTHLWEKKACKFLQVNFGVVLLQSITWDELGAAREIREI